MEENSSIYCSRMQGIILDSLINERTSKKVAPFEILSPKGGYSGNLFDQVSIYSRTELESLLGQTYETGDAEELANLLILREVFLLLHGERRIA